MIESEFSLLPPIVNIDLDLECILTWLIVSNHHEESSTAPREQTPMGLLVILLPNGIQIRRHSVGQNQLPCLQCLCQPLSESFGVTIPKGSPYRLRCISQFLHIGFRQILLDQRV